MSLLVCAMMVGSIGCSGNSGSVPSGMSNEMDKQAPQVEAPAQFVIFTSSATVPSDFQWQFGDVLSKKFPNTKFVQLQESSDKSTKLAELISSGQEMDAAQYGLTNSAEFVDLDYPMDLDPLVKKNSFDLNRFEPEAIKAVRSYSPNGELIALPFEYQPFVLYYNKDIFDKFGVPYPKVGSTWDDLIELSRKLTRTEDGIQYKGLNPGNLNRMQMQLSNPYVDIKTHKSLVLSTPGWTKMFQTFLNIYSVPGNTPGNGANEFLQSKNLAMFPHLLKGVSTDAWQKAIDQGLRLGVSTFPVFKEAPGIGTGFFGSGLYIPKSSKYPDFAFQVLQYMVSDEMQIRTGKNGLASALRNPAVQNALLEGNPIVKEIGFDISLIDKIKLAPSYQRTEWDDEASKIVNKYINDVSNKKSDVNTALREADAEVNQMLLANPPKK
ncbi:MAG: family 1 extracellular solute-binding protein [Paenibacillaceae bacterium]|nr:family 1 extracellular solute-binding protein [Paenibacillaceae bacterium]